MCHCRECAGWRCPNDTGLVLLGDNPNRDPKSGSWAERAVSFYQRGEFRPWKMMQKLIEQACHSYHVGALLANARGDDPAKEDAAHACL